MSILKFIKSITVQTATYWGSPVNDGYGSYTYATPVEIQCRWEDKVRTVFDVYGEYQQSKSSVLVNQDVDYNGYMFLGTIAEATAITGVTITNPKTVPMAYPILSFDRIPLIRSTTEFVHVVYLGFRNL